MSWLDALAEEIRAKKDKLVEVQALIEQSKSLLDEVKRLEAIHASAFGVKPKKAGVRSPRSEEQKKAASERMAAIWAAKKAGGVVPRPKVVRAKAK